MRDPLHVPHSELVVVHKGKDTMILNKRLIDQQNCWDNVDTIKMLHGKRLHLEDAMKACTSTARLKLYDSLYTDLEFKLQDAWLFDRNANMHRFWNRPGCTCPKMDNEDLYGTEISFTSGNCPLHSHIPALKEEE